MIKFTLIIWVCSFLGQPVCLEPIQHTTLYNTWYECSRAAHRESIKVYSKLGYKAVNQSRLATRYTCQPHNTI